MARYQVKCAEYPIVGYETFLKAFAAHQDARKRNWWMAVNLSGEPKPGKPGTRERFTVSGVPGGATYFAVRSFDNARNRSEISNRIKIGSKP